MDKKKSTPTVASVQEESALSAIPPEELEERSVDDVMRQIEKIQTLMRRALKKDEHYGTIPGTLKPTLLKSGAEKICFTFRLQPKFGINRIDLDNCHREYEIVCDLYNTNTGAWMGQGVGCCSTMESKYRWRKSERECPSCGGGSIFRSKYSDKNTGEKGWYCNKRAGGCGSQFGANEPDITGQETGKKENPDIADVYNTVLKMAKKRAQVDATLAATAASDFFTQDVEDFAASPASETAPQSSSDGPATEGQIKKLWHEARKKADETGAIREEIMKDVLIMLDIKHSSEMRQSHIDQALDIVSNWEPGPIAEGGGDGL